MRVLVTGARGRLGAALVPALLAAGHEVRALSRSAVDGAMWTVADLATGAGVREAVSDVDAIAHLASSPYRRRYTRLVDVHGTARLVAAARDAGVRHVLYPSVVGVDRVPWGYYRLKLAAEEHVRTGGVPFTVLRATQFHEFIAHFLEKSRSLPVRPVDPSLLAQPVDVRDVAARMTELLATGPTGTIEEFAGPEVLTAAEVVEEWRLATADRTPSLRLRMPGRFARAVRDGGLTAPAHATGVITWRRYLADPAHPGEVL